MARAHPYNHMTGFIIDTLKLANKLQEAGINKKAAEVFAEELKDIQQEVLKDVATIQSVESLRTETKQSVENLRLETKGDIGGLRSDIGLVRKDIEGLRLEMRIMEQRLVMKLGGLIALAVAVISFLDKVIA